MGIDLAESIPQWEREADEHERKAQALRQIIAGVRALNGEAQQILGARSFEAHRVRFEIGAPQPDAPRGRRAVLALMGERSDHRWKVIEIKRELIRRGWSPSPKAVEASVKKLRESGEIRSAGYGHYKLVSANGGGGENAEGGYAST